MAASWFYEAKSSRLVSGNVSSFGLGDESFAWNSTMASIGCIKSMSYWLLLCFLFLSLSQTSSSDYSCFVMQLAADMQRFSRPERRINGPTITHLWSVLFIYIFIFGLELIPRFSVFDTTSFQVMMASSYPLKTSFSILGPCWSYLMSWCNLIISKTPKQAYLMISLGIRGMEIIFGLYDFAISWLHLLGPLKWVCILFLLFVLLIINDLFFLHFFYW